VTTFEWEIRDPDTGSRGAEVARGACDESSEILAHAMPARIDVRVWREDGAVLHACGFGLEAAEGTPLTRLSAVDGVVTRASTWPTDDDIGRALVILPGGEIGTLTAWWNSPEHDAWRWSIELENAIGPPTGPGS
jgi:hypothetical protein